MRGSRMQSGGGGGMMLLVIAVAVCCYSLQKQAHTHKGPEALPVGTVEALSKGCCISHSAQTHSGEYHWAGALFNATGDVVVYCGQVVVVSVTQQHRTTTTLLRN